MANDDVWSMLQAARPRQVIDIGTPEPGAIRRTRTSDQVISGPDGTPRRVDDLITLPGSAAYRSKIPPPPCVKCGEDHVPNHQYDHQYVQESASPQEQSLPQSAYVPPALAEAAPAVQMRVAVYVGRGDDIYIVAAEQSPDWDTIRSFKVEANHVMPMVNLARALGIKVQDKTGGDLVALSEIGD